MNSSSRPVVHGTRVTNAIFKSTPGRAGHSFPFFAPRRKAGSDDRSARNDAHGRDGNGGKRWSLRRKQEHRYNALLAGNDAAHEIRGDDDAAGAALIEALRLQGAYGFPHPPAGTSRLTHGFHHYPAAMQPATAGLLLDRDGGLLPGRTLLDPFCGGGTTLIEGMRHGRVTFGADTSPLALFIAKGRTWLPKNGKVGALRACVAKVTSEESDNAKREMITRKSWQSVRDGIDRELRKGTKDGDEAVGETTRTALAPILWFCYNAAFERANKARQKKNTITSASQYFASTVEEYLKRISELMSEAGGTCQSPKLLRGDARSLSLDNDTKVDAILTSPPYPGVYDYLKHAREQRARLKTNFTHYHCAPREGSADGFMTTDIPASRMWPDSWSRGEIGSYKSLRRNVNTFKADWQRDTEDWIARSAFLLQGPGSRIAVMIGDGFGIDALDSILLAVRKLPADTRLRLVASATLRRKGERTEHMLLLERT